MYSSLCDPYITPSHLINMKTDHLVNKARTAATLWLECDDHLAKLQDEFGIPWIGETPQVQENHPSVIKLDEWMAAARPFGA